MRAPLQALLSRCRPPPAATCSLRCLHLFLFTRAAAALHTLKRGLVQLPDGQPARRAQAARADTGKLARQRRRLGARPLRRSWLLALQGLRPAAVLFERHQPAG